MPIRRNVDIEIVLDTLEWMMAPERSGGMYHPIHNNCHHFVEHLCILMKDIDKEVMEHEFSHMEEEYGVFESVRSLKERLQGPVSPAISSLPRFPSDSRRKQRGRFWGLF